MTDSGLAGRLQLRPGSVPAIVGHRPVIGAVTMRRLADGRRATLLPDLVGAMFTLCAGAQRATSRRAVRAAFGVHDDAAEAARDALVLSLSTAREHLQRLALDLPTLLPQPGAAPDPGWIRDAPVMALPAPPAGLGDVALHAVAAALPDWLERRLLGLPAARWIEHWQSGRGAWLQQWAQDHRAHPATRWLRAVQPLACATPLPCRPLGVLAEGEVGLRALAGGLAADDSLAERPLWRGAPAETGPWARHGRDERVATAWDRLGARIADLLLVALMAHDRPLAAGALTVAPGEGIAWTEMSRGLLLHWVRLEDGARDPEAARTDAYRVVAPTEWNFHPDGALAQALATMDARAARVAAATMDPCVAFEIETHDA